MVYVRSLDEKSPDETLNELRPLQVEFQTKQCSQGYDWYISDIYVYMYIRYSPIFRWIEKLNLYDSQLRLLEHFSMQWY